MKTTLGINLNNYHQQRTESESAVGRRAPNAGAPIRGPKADTRRLACARRQLLSLCGLRAAAEPSEALGAPAGKPVTQVLEEKINDGRSEKGESLRDKQAADNGDAEGLAQFRASADAYGEGDRAEHGGQGGHHDRSEPDQAGLVDGVLGFGVFGSFGFDGEIDHKDGVLLDDADQENDADEGNEREFEAGGHERQESPDAGRG